METNEKLEEYKKIILPQIESFKKEADKKAFIFYCIICEEDKRDEIRGDEEDTEEEYHKKRRERRAIYDNIKWLKSLYWPMPEVYLEAERINYFNE